MPSDLKILANRKGYEFTTDNICLSMLATKPITDHIQQLFQFQLVTIGSPLPTFGDVPAAFPPGVIFDHGVAFSSEDRMVPIRFLHFEPQRIVIDVTGETAAIDAVFQQLVSALSETRSPDGSPIIGTPERVLAYSEVTAHFSFPLETLVTPPLRNILCSMTNARENGNNSCFIPYLALSPFSKKPSDKSSSQTSIFPFTLSVRTGTQPEEHLYFSSAPLDAEAHQAYLNKLELALAPA